MALDQIIHGDCDPVTWYTIQHQAVEEMCTTSFPLEPGTYQSKHFADFYSSFQQYITSDKYVVDIQKFSSIPFSSQILTSVMFVIQTKVLRIKSEEVRCENVPKRTHIFPSSQTTDTAAGQGKVRYVGGYCVAKCRFRLCSALQNCLYKPVMEQEVENLNDQINMLDRVIVSSTKIHTDSKYPYTLNEIDQQQNVREGLTHITDNAFVFFHKLEKALVSYMQYETLCAENKYLFKYVVNCVLSCTELLETFVEKMDVCCLFDETDAECVDSYVIEVCARLSLVCGHVLSLYEMISRLFVTVVISQFRKDYLRSIQREKGVALRKKVAQKVEKKNVETVTIQSMKKDKSSSKCSTHYKLKAVALSNDKFYTTYTKADLKLILLAYGEKMPSRSTKTNLGDKLRSVLVNDTCVSMIDSGVLNESLAIVTNQPEEQLPLDIEATLEDHPQHLQLAQVISVQSQLLVAGSGLPIPGPSNSVSLEMELNSKIAQNLEAASPIPGCSTEKDNTQSTMKKTKAAQKKRAQPKSKVKPRTQSKLKGKGAKSTKCRSTKTECEDDYNEQCSICGKFLNKSDQRIECDACSSEFHIICVHLEDDEDWEYFSITDSIFICPQL